MKVKIVAKHTGLGNQIQFIPFIEELKKEHEVFSDSKVYSEFGVLDTPKEGWGDVNFVVFGYSWKKFWKVRKTAKGKFVGFKYRIKRKHIGIGYSQALRFDEAVSEIENNRRLYNAVFGKNMQEVKFSIPSPETIKGKVVIGISPKEEKTLPYKLWLEVIDAVKQRGYDVEVVDHNIGVPEYKATPTLKDLKESIGSAQYYLGTDSGPMHLADILEVPALVMFGSTDITKNGPQLEGSMTYTRNLECSPCFDWGRVNCPYNFRCMNFELKDIMSKFDALCNRSSS